MIVIRLEFPAGRYHATPDGRHVNEGVTEWPPSPYRLLRAMVDVWHRKCSDLEQSEVESVLMALAGSPPRFRLPQGVAAHTRSYLSANEYDPSAKNLVFDGFLAFDPGAVCTLAWRDVQLTGTQQKTLERLLTSLNYLGRSESWIHASLSAEECGGIACDPLDTDDGAGEQVRVACVRSADEYSGKRSWLDALAISTAQVAKDRASSPPLLRSVLYRCPKDAVVTDPVSKKDQRSTGVRSVLLTLDSPVLPLITSTLEVAEQIRVRLMGAHKRLMGGDESRVSDLFSGKGHDGEKSLGHEHVYILPLRKEDDIRIDRVLLTSKRVWNRKELDAAYSVRRLWQGDNKPDVQCAVAWTGQPKADSFLWTEATAVESVTPFVAPRHWRRGRDHDAFLQEEVRRECRHHGLDEPLSVEVNRSLRNGIFECVEYRRNRKNDPVRPGYAVHLTFPQKVLTPFAMGYGAHFGLGQFQAAD